VESVTLGPSPKFQRFHATRSSDYVPLFSPDGRWAAVDSDESGTGEVYVRSFPDPTVKVQVSVGGGGGAVWSADGTRLYYSTGTVIVEARLATTPGLRVLSRDTAFTGVPNGLGGFGQANFDVSRDGSRIVVPSVQSAAYPLVVVPNWRKELARATGGEPELGLARARATDRTSWNIGSHSTLTSSAIALAGWG
jgi:Tol biopolymer transport system component